MEIKRRTDDANIIYGAYGSATAGGSGDDTEILSAAIDVQGYDSAIVSALITTTLGEGDTLNGDFKITHADTSGGSYTDAETFITNATLATGGSGGSTETGDVSYRVDLTGVKRYIKISFTPDLSAANTDTADVMTALVITNGQERPETLSTTL